MERIHRYSKSSINNFSSSSLNNSWPDIPKRAGFYFTAAQRNYSTDGMNWTSKSLIGLRKESIDYWQWNKKQQRVISKINLNFHVSSVSTLLTGQPCGFFLSLCILICNIRYQSHSAIPLNNWVNDTHCLAQCQAQLMVATIILLTQNKNLCEKLEWLFYKSTKT